MLDLRPERESFPFRKGVTRAGKIPLRVFSISS
jgi:hypothetical protein